MTTLKFRSVYVQSYGAVSGPIEHCGPLGLSFDGHFEDLYGNEKTYEKCERMMIEKACDFALRKGKIEIQDLDLMVGGDLMNQLSSVHYFGKDINVPFLGVYGACSNSALSLGIASEYVEYEKMQVMCFTSSHNATAERQFRYPNEYGVQKKESTTYTVTGAGSVILSNDKTDIKITSYTIGKIVDWQFKEANDMGIAMVPAAYDTICTHLKDMNRTVHDYDLIITGDLSKAGLSFLTDLFLRDGITYEHFDDCGLRIFDVHQQNVFCGGSGCACSMCVCITDLFPKLTNGTYQRILYVPTGALLSPIALQQKESIPCIAHALCFERSE